MERLKTMADYEHYHDSLACLAREIHACAKAKGWYGQERSPLELLCLIHSELSECCEAFRAGDPPDKHLPELRAVEVELADAMIRILDMGEALGLRLADAITAKVRYNWTRAERHGGKAY
jgi:NTP pyrophosphatase (non-canonical NTP hydrolase)